jgi:hypothetical protein
MIPEKTAGTGSNNYPQFVKQSELISGAIAKIESEFAPPENPKIQSPLIGNISFKGGELYTLGLNWTTYYSLAPIYGKDTQSWIGKEIQFLGMKTMGKGRGYAWVAYESIK